MVKQRQLEKLKQRVEPENWTDGIEMPLALMGACHEDPAILASLAFRSIISAKQFSREQIVQLCRLAAKFEASQNAGYFPLTGRILISAFYEPSTRTRLSFESVWQRLGGDIISITDPSTTGIAKGESYHDVAEMMNHYGDVVVLRDSNEDAIYEMHDALRIPIVNAGNGIDEHPTQALADVYAIFKWQPALMVGGVDPKDRITIGIIGVPGRMRTVRSLLTLLSRFSGSINEVIIVSNTDEVFSEGQREELEKDGLRLRVTTELNKALPNMDIVYINAIAWVGDSYEELGTEYALTTKSPLKKNAIILHPLARGDELDTGLDSTPHNWYFAQARGAVYMRMALLSTLMRF
ncbi:MAG: aspartate carbamoyltransferase [Gammaproteobacteria bacterium]|nr:aspartate carbamoyltransferase [Gammaproteobacteria bacterium]